MIGKVGVWVGWVGGHGRRSMNARSTTANKTYFLKMDRSDARRQRFSKIAYAQGSEGHWALS